MKKQKLAGIFSNRLTIIVGLLVMGLVGVLGFSFFFSQSSYASTHTVEFFVQSDRCTRDPSAGSSNSSQSTLVYNCVNYVNDSGVFVAQGTCEIVATGGLISSQECEPGGYSRVATADEISDGAAEGQPDSVDVGPQCGIEGGLGWIVCPAAWLTSKVIDGALLFLHQMLYVSPLSMDFNTQNNPMYAIWSAVRNLANVLFAMVFLIIIFSQATSIGISNYGIKRMLPRIIVAAVLVNASYFIAAIGIEVSNLFGRGVTSMMDAIVSNTGAGQSQGTAIGFEAVVLGLLFVGGSAAALFALAPEFSMSAILAAVLPVLIIAAFAVFVALVTLIARQAIIIMLVVLAPLAFVANLLPNTEGLYKKWQKLFMTMLIFYPLVVFVFSGAQVAAYILRATSDGGALMQVFSLGVQVVPLFALPFLFKTAGGVLGKVHGMVNQPDKLGVGRLRKEAEQFRDDKRLEARKRNLEKPAPTFKDNKFGRARGKAYKAYGVLSPGRRAKGAVEAEGKRKSMQQNLEESKTAHLASKALKPDEDKFRRQMAGLSEKEAAEGTPEVQDALNRVQARAVSAEREIESKNRSAAIAMMQHRGIDQDREALEAEIVRDGASAAEAGAAAELILKTAGTENYHRILARDEIKNKSEEFVNELVEAGRREYNVIDTKSVDLADALSSKDFAAAVQNGTVTDFVSDARRSQRMTKLPAGKMIGLDPEAAKRFENYVATEASNDQKIFFQREAELAMKNPNYANTKEDTKYVIERMAAGNFGGQSGPQGGQPSGGSSSGSGGGGTGSGGGGTSGGGSTGGSGTSSGNTGSSGGPGPSPGGSGSSSGGSTGGQSGPQGGRPSGGSASGGQSGTPSGSGGSGPNPNQGGPTGGPGGEYKVPHDKNPPPPSPPPGSFLG